MKDGHGQLSREAIERRLQAPGLRAALDELWDVHQQLRRWADATKLRGADGQWLASMLVTIEPIVGALADLGVAGSDLADRRARIAAHTAEYWSKRAAEHQQHLENQLRLWRRQQRQLGAQVGGGSSGKTRRAKRDRFCEAVAATRKKNPSLTVSAAVLSVLKNGDENGKAHRTKKAKTAAEKAKRAAVKAWNLKTAAERMKAVKAGAEKFRRWKNHPREATET